MSLNNSILNLFGITDENIKITECYECFIGKNSRRRKVNVINALLTYAPTRCKQCGYKQIKYGYKSVDARLPTLNGKEVHLKLKKQRFICKNCGSTSLAHSSILLVNHTVTRDFKKHITELVKESFTIKSISKLLGISASTVSRILYESNHIKYRQSSLPEHLCFDEFRSVGSLMSFICCDAVSHKLVTFLPDRLTKDIVDYFINRYSLKERQQVKTVVVDMNAQYSHFIKRIFPNAEIIIDRFHIIQLVGRALDQSRLHLLKQIKDHKSREYKILKSQWRLFHKHATELESKRPYYLRGINEYMTTQNAVDLITTQFPEYARDYHIYQNILQCISDHNVKELRRTIMDYRPNGSAMDTTITTLKSNLKYIENSIKYTFSNGPLEGINRKIKQLKRNCYGFRNLDHFFVRIQLIHE